MTEQSAPKFWLPATPQAAQPDGDRQGPPAPAPAPANANADKATSERLSAWRRQREKVAEARRDETRKKAEVDRQERLRQFEEERKQRIKDAADARAQEEAARRFERLTNAKAKLADRADLDAARARIIAERKSRWRRAILRLGIFVALPLAAVAYYLFAVATPFYEAEARFVVADKPQPQTASTSPGTAGLLGSVNVPRSTFVARDIILSRATLDALNQKDNFASHMGDASVDPVSRFRAIPALEITEFDRFRRQVGVTINAHEGSVTLRVTGRSADEAQRFSRTILAHLETRLAGLGMVGKPGQPAITVYQQPEAGGAPRYPRKLSSLAMAAFVLIAAYALGSILLATLRRHATS